MKEKLPIWFQALALVCLSCVFLATIWWISHEGRTLSRQRLTRGSLFDVPAVHNTVSYLMPLPIAWLGGRFLWSFRRAQERKTVRESAFYVVGLLFTLITFITLLIFIWPWLTSQQRVRETGYFLAQSQVLSEPAVSIPLSSRG